MSKRTATTELNHDNWDQEDDYEEPEEPKQASAEELSKRIIKTAKRRMDQNSERKNPFAGFGGFSTIPKPPTINTNKITESASSFFTNSNLKDTSDKKLELKKPPTINTNKITESASSFFTNSNLKDTSDKKLDLKKNSNKYSDDYCSKVKSLNLCFLKWISKHIEENAICNLEPTFRDYEKHFQQIETEEHNIKEEKDNNNVKKFQFTQKVDFSKKSETLNSEPAITFKFGSTENMKPKLFENPFTTNSKPDTFTGISSSPTTNNLNLNKNLNQEEKTTPVFTFGKKDDKDNKKDETKNSTTLFSFGQYTSPSTNTNIFGGMSSNNSLSAKPSGFSFMTPPAPSKETSEKQNKNEEDASDEPPKNEFTPVVEDDAKFSQRCKVFIKKDADYQERGIGTLYLKSVPNSKRTQLIVRADTNLGTLLVNLLLTDKVPLKLMGKKDVMLVGKATPNEDSPKPILLRVKDQEMATKLHAELEKAINEGS